MSEPSDVVSLIDSWPSLSDFARDAGVTYGAAKQMRRRRSVPVDYWPALIGSDRGAASNITADVLMRLHAPAPTPSDPEPAPCPA